MRTIAPGLSKARLEQLLFPHGLDDSERLPDAKPASATKKPGLIGFAGAPQKAALAELLRPSERPE